MGLNRFNEFIEESNFNIVKTKKRLFKYYYKQLFRYLYPLIKINGLPDTIDEKDLLYYLYSVGYVTFGKSDDGKLYIFNGNLGGEPNQTYLPTKSVVANPFLKFNKTYTIDEDCVVVKCDSMYQGFNDLVSLTSALLTSIDISIYWNVINSRTTQLYESANDSITKSINDVFDSLENGDKLKAIASKPLFDLLKTREYSSMNVSANLKSLIEIKQYIKASYFMMIGLPSNYNMKRESLNENELDADIYTITPDMDDVFNTLTDDIAKVNNMFSVNITIERASSLAKVDSDIENREKEENADIELVQKQIEEIENNINNTSDAIDVKEVEENENN